jgi:hypothetical protein
MLKFFFSLMGIAVELTELLYEIKLGASLGLILFISPCVLLLSDPNKLGCYTTLIGSS